MRILIILLIFSSVCLAALNDWQTVTNMNFVRDLESDDNLLWVASTGGLYSYDLENEQITGFTNVNGLKAIEISSIEMDTRNQLVVAG